MKKTGSTGNTAKGPFSLDEPMEYDTKAVECADKDAQTGPAEDLGAAVQYGKTCIQSLPLKGLGAR